MTQILDIETLLIKLKIKLCCRVQLGNGAFVINFCLSVFPHKKEGFIDFHLFFSNQIVIL